MKPKLLRHALILIIIRCLNTVIIAQSTSPIYTIERLVLAEKYDEAIKYGDSLLAIKALSPIYFQIYRLQADAYYSLNNIERSLQKYLLALATDEINEEKNMATLEEVMSHTAFCYNELGLDEEAYTYYRKSLAVAETLSDSSEIAVCHFNISNSLLKLGRLDQAMDHLNKAYTIDVLQKDTASIGFDLNGMGYAQLISGFPEKSIKYYKASIELLKMSSGNQSSLGTRYNNLGNAFLATKQLDSAAYYVRKSIAEHEKHRDSLNLAERWISLATIFNQMGQYNTALFWAEKAKTYFTTRELNSQAIQINFSLIEAYKGLGKQGTTIELIRQTIESAKKLGLLVPLSKAVLLEAEYLEKAGYYQQALERYRYHNLLNDSILSQQNHKKMYELEVRYKVDNITQANKILMLEKEAAQADSHLKTIQLRWLMTGLLIVIIAAISIAWILVSRHKLKQQLLISEIDGLRSQIKLVIDGNTAEIDISKDAINKRLQTPLSEREFEILSLALGDLSNSEIASKTFVSVNTVKFHLKNIYEKLGVGNRKGALQFALQSKTNP